MHFSWSESISCLILAGIAFVLSFLPRQILIILSAIAVVAAIVMGKMFGTPLTAWHMTPVTLSEWGSAVLLTLVASGLGLGVYAQSNAQAAKVTENTTPLVLPIWVAQILAVVVFGFFSAQTEISELTLLTTMVFGAALLLQFAKQQLQERQVSIIVQYAILLAPLCIWTMTVALPVLNMVMMLWGLVTCLIYAIFVGWIMKISHLRKALNFSNEMVYNVWRIAIRVIAPLSIILAIVGVVLGRF